MNTEKQLTAQVSDGASAINDEKNDGCFSTGVMAGGDRATSDYSVSHLDNWVRRANNKVKVITRTKHVS